MAIRSRHCRGSRALKPSPGSAWRDDPGPPLRITRSAHHDVERRPRRTLAQSAEECASCPLPIRELVVQVPAPGGDHGENKDSALAQQVLISAGIALAHIFGDMGEVELNRSTATRLEIDEKQSGLRAEHVAWVRLAVQQLLGSATVDDRLSSAPQRSEEKLPVRVGKIRGEVSGLHKVLSLFHSVGEVRRPEIELAHAGMQSLKRIRVAGR